MSVLGAVQDTFMAPGEFSVLFGLSFRGFLFLAIVFLIHSSNEMSRKKSVS